MECMDLTTQMLTLPAMGRVIDIFVRFQPNAMCRIPHGCDKGHHQIDILDSGMNPSRDEFLHDMFANIAQGCILSMQEVKQA